MRTASYSNKIPEFRGLKFKMAGFVQIFYNSERERYKENATAKRDQTLHVLCHGVCAGSGPYRNINAP